MIEEVSADGSLVARFTHGLGMDDPLAMLRGNTMSYYLADGLGSVTSLSDAKGNLVSTYQYDSFGNLTASTGSIFNPFRYTGREFDPETGLYFYRARYYDPSIGRFISEDPIQFGGGINFYRYVLNNPLYWLDPFGLFEKKCNESYTDCKSRCLNAGITGAIYQVSDVLGIGSEIAFVCSGLATIAESVAQNISEKTLDNMKKIPTYNGKKKGLDKFKKYATEQNKYYKAKSRFKKYMRFSKVSFASSAFFTASYFGIEYYCHSKCN